MPILKVAIIGGGHIADQNHIPALKALGDRVEIVSICSRVKEKARALADKHQIPFAYDKAAEMYAGEGRPDIVVICTANNLHYPFAIQALENDCHVFCEKPPALSAEQASEMAELAREKGKILAYNLQLRQTPEFTLIKKCREEGTLGRIYHIKANYLRRRGIPGWGNFTNKSIQGGGALMDLGVHILDLALEMLDYQMPDRIVANTYDFLGKAGGKGLMGEWNPDSFEVEDACFAHLSFPDNSSISLSASFALNMKAEKDINLEVFGTNGGAVYKPLSLFTEIGSELANIDFPHIEEADIQLKNTIAFLDACEGKHSNIANAEQGAILQKIVSKIYESAGS
ncbi:Gfo/Idh/MocA family protein [Dyadobacter sp. CY343]|uniref:Gfo/Idh/MocA family protein n=1 Tax=Dyadobacter sp. CY343 TaxID=2907299 RepID=UPI001F48BD7C|nr:Gfo/Idh/MocA family oxidoreductase [Dyadobacter sp. CY343]MCE7063445.1 Gfo/Idh/MocA family oxidoreductase [Dyadobacter sp. CY343]